VAHQTLLLLLFLAAADETFGKVDPLAVQQVQRVAAGLAAAGNGHDSGPLGRVPGGAMQLGAGGISSYDGGIHGDSHGGYQERSHHSSGRRGGGGMAYMEVEQPITGGGGRRQHRRQPQFAPGPNAGKGIPGKICAECGATQTPQWREGPLGASGLHVQGGGWFAKGGKHGLLGVGSSNGGGDWELTREQRGFGNAH
jgi:hypothetical protein